MEAVDAYYTLSADSGIVWILCVCEYVCVAMATPGISPRFGGARRNGLLACTDLLRPARTPAARPLRSAPARPAPPALLGRGRRTRPRGTLGGSRCPPAPPFFSVSAPPTKFSARSCAHAHPRKSAASKHASIKQYREKRSLRLRVLSFSEFRGRPVDFCSEP